MRSWPLLLPTFSLFLFSFSVFCFWPTSGKLPGWKFVSANIRAGLGWQEILRFLAKYLVKITRYLCKALTSDLCFLPGPILSKLQLHESLRVGQRRSPSLFMIFSLINVKLFSRAFCTTSFPKERTHWWQLLKVKRKIKTVGRILHFFFFRSGTNKLFTLTNPDSKILIDFF